MEKIGVAAVVEGLSGFLGDMDKMDNSIRKLISPTNILGSVFDGLGNIVSNLVGGVFRTLEYTLGTLIAGAITYVTGQIKELISNTIEAAGEFQKLELRLNTLNFNALTESGMDFNTAQAESIRLTQEQLSWLQKLAATTPYDNADISNTYTLARGYGFVDDRARSLTDTIVDFASGMGLGNTEMVRIIKNFGQMQQLGKVMQRDLNDLATGAFVPVNDVLKQMREELGMTAEEQKDFLKTQEGVDAFISSFTTLVEGRFGGAAQKMARTFGAATDNMKDFIKSVFGLNIVKPVLDVLGGRLAEFMDEVTSPERWDTIVGLATRMGDAFSGIVTDLLGLAPDTRSLADKVVAAFETMTEWVEENRPKITEFVQGAITAFRDDLLPKIEQVWKFLFGDSDKKGAIQKFGEWLKTDLVPFIQNQVLPGLDDLFAAITGSRQKKDPTKDQTTREDVNATPLENVVAGIASLATALPSVLELLKAIGGVIQVAFGGDETQTFSEFVTNTLIPGIQELTKFVKENQEALAFMFKALLALEIIGYIVSLVLSFVVAIVSLATAFLTLSFVVGLVGAIVIAFKVFQAQLTILVTSVITVVTTIIQWFTTLRDGFVKIKNDIVTAWKNQDWAGLGKALVQGIWQGISAYARLVIDIVRNLAYNAMNTWRSIFKIQSPSAVMADMGENMVLGLVKGVQTSSKLAVAQMSKTAEAVLAAASPRMAYSAALTGPSQNTYQTNNAFNLNVNSSARTEPIISDFGMMASLVGS